MSDQTSVTDCFNNCYCVCFILVFVHSLELLDHLLWSLVEGVLAKSLAEGVKGSIHRRPEVALQACRKLSLDTHAL